jgi:peptide/nickel transport system ATP-binding protein
VLAIENLKVTIGKNTVAEVESMTVSKGQRIGFVGESGSGKSMIALSILGLQPRSAIVDGSIRFNGVELLGLSDQKMADIRGRLIGLVPQDPTKSLNPTMRIGKQISEAIFQHSDARKPEVDLRVRELLDNVQLADSDRIVNSYPHQLSGGQQQRVLIAMAIACEPMLLIADEPTTALDMTVQGDILRLLLNLSIDLGMGLLFVSHDLGVVRYICNDVAVIYGGQVAEFGPIGDLVARPAHRYSDALISANIALPRDEDDIARRISDLRTIKGSVPSMGEFPEGCRFRNRCDFQIPACASPVPMTAVNERHLFRCCNPIEYEERADANN